MNISIFKILFPSITAFLIGILITPIISYYLYKYKLWKKKNYESDMSGNATPITASILNDGNRKTPRMGGMVVVLATLFTIFLYFILGEIFSESWLIQKLNFVDRKQTWLPIIVFILGSLIGLIDDLASTQFLPFKNKHGEYGMPLRYRLIFVSLFGFLSGWWFFYKLGFDYIHIPFWIDFHLGIFIIPFFIILFLATYGASNIDGLDGLSGGIFAIIFATYGFIASINNQFDIASFCFVIVGSLLAFLWFNVPPARFYLSEVGYMPLAALLAVIAVLTNAVILLIIIAAPLVFTEITTIIQIISKKFYKRKIFPVTPIHNTFVYMGWSKEKVVMRYWIVSTIFALFGFSLYLIS